MAKKSFTKSEQLEHLVHKWGIARVQVDEMLKDVRRMDMDALKHGERLYWDNFGTMHVEIKKPIKKRLPGKPLRTFPGRVNVKFIESDDFRAELNDSFRSELADADNNG